MSTEPIEPNPFEIEDGPEEEEEFETETDEE